MAAATPWCWIICGLAIMGGFGRPADALAQMSETRAREISTAIVKILVPVAIARHVVAQCDGIAPAGREARHAALERWRAAHRIGAFEAAVARFFARLPRSGDAMQKLETSTSAAAKSMVEKTAAICTDQLETLLAGPTFALAAQVDAALPRIRSLTQGGSTAAPPPPPAAATVYTLAQLSAKALAAMSAIAPAEAAMDSKMRDARRKAGETALEALGVIAVGGHVIGRDRLRGWYGDQQSTFTARCRSFVDRLNEDRFNVRQGQDVVVTATVSSLYDDREGGGSITLAKCALVEDASRLEKAALPETGGLELRPPEPAEAYGGPGTGIAPETVAKVVYKADFQALMDGFGNGYTQRAEDTYVLLKDGTAYHHHWRFPFSDVNLLLVKHREPGRWFTWREDGNTLQLTATGGSKAGQTRAVKDYDTLLPLPAGTRWETAFYYLNVAAMGARSDRNYAFHADGTLDVKTSSFVAARTGVGSGSDVSGPGFSYSDGQQGFLMVDGMNRERRLQYRIDGYLLELFDEAGRSERHFIARFGSDRADPPASLYLDGQVLWTKDKKDGK